MIKYFVFVTIGVIITILIFGGLFAGVPRKKSSSPESTAAVSPGPTVLQD